MAALCYKPQASAKGHHLTFIEADIHIFTGPSRTAANTWLDPVHGHRPAHAPGRVPEKQRKVRRDWRKEAGGSDKLQFREEEKSESERICHTALKTRYTRL